MSRSRHQIFLSFVVVLFSFASMCKGQDVDALIVIDIDGTIGEQTTKTPDFKFDGVVRVPEDRAGDFFFFENALHFLKTLYRWRDESSRYDKKVEIALFTMGSGIRNEKIRTFIENSLDLKAKTLGLFDFSNAVFSDQLVKRWRDKDPTLPAHWREYFDELDKPIFSAPLPAGASYYKDLTRLLAFYKGLKLANIRLVDDNPLALPADQKHQLFVFGPKVDFLPEVEKLKVWLGSIR